MPFYIGSALTSLQEVLGYGAFESLTSDYIITLFTRDEFIDTYVFNQDGWTPIAQRLFDSLSIEAQNNIIREDYLKSDIDSMSIMQVVYCTNEAISFVIVARRAV